MASWRMNVENLPLQRMRPSSRCPTYFLRNGRAAGQLAGGAHVKTPSPWSLPRSNLPGRESKVE